MAQVDVNRPAAVDDFLGKGGDDAVELAAFEAHRIVFLHEAFAARVDEPRALRHRDVVARHVHVLHQHAEGAAEGELHVDEPRAGAIAHDDAIAGVVVDTVRALHRDHAGGEDRALGAKHDELAAMHVEAHRADDALGGRPFAIGREQIGDADAIDDFDALFGDALAQFLYRGARLVLHAAHVDHAAAGEAADAAVRVARDRHAPFVEILDPLALALQELHGPVLVAHVAAAGDELIGPEVEVVAVERTGGYSTRYGRCAAAADIGFVHQHDVLGEVGGAVGGPATGETAAQDQDVGINDFNILGGHWAESSTEMFD